MSERSNVGEGRKLANRRDRTFWAGWRQVFACFVLMATGSMLASAYGIVAVPLSHTFQPSRMVLMLAITAMTAGSAVLAPTLGKMMDRISIRSMLAIGSCLIVAGFLALSFVASFVQALLVYGILMASANILIGPMAATVLLPRWFVQRRGTALGIAISGVAAGTAVYPLIIQSLLDSYEWRTAFRLLALVLALVTSAAVALVIERPSVLGLHPDGAPAEPEAAKIEMSTAPLSTREILADRAFWLIALLMAVVLSGMIGVVTNVVAMALDAGISHAAAARLLMVYAMTGLVAKLGFAATADRLNLRVLIFVVLGLFAAGMASLMVAKLGYWVIVVGTGLIGTGGVIVPLTSFLVPRIFGQHVVGHVSGLLNIFVLSALLVTPPIFGYIFDLTGGYRLAYVTFTALVVATLFMVPLLRLHPKPLHATDRDGTFDEGKTLAEQA